MKTLAAVLLAAAALGAVGAGPESDPARVVVSGEHDPRLEPFDRLMTTFVAENRVPGAALAVARDGRVVYARGFGHADLDRAEPVRPDSLFRVASVSKPVTAAAVSGSSRARSGSTTRR
ncbi:MAG: serine hydrolase domain-containing protein [Isosphaeraceae bacterium]